MFACYLSISVLFWTLSALATPLHATDSQATSLAAPSNVNYPNLIPLSDPPVPDHTPLNGKTFEIQCNGAAYGFNPPLIDYDQAREQISPDLTQQTFGQRHTGLGDHIWPLPYLVMGGRYITSN